MRMMLAALLVLVCGIGPGRAAVRPQEKLAPKTHTVVMQDMEFTPAVLTIKAGESVEWVNKDAMPHNVFSKEGGFESDDLPEGKSFKYTAEKKGEFPYLCTLHRSMKGTLKVE
jgi:plastocyanin